MFKTVLRSYSKVAREIPSIACGQPIFETRPHLVKPGQLTPGITAMEYYQRRLELGTKMQKGSVAIIPGSRIKYASGPVFYPFHQNTDLYYLTGWNEPDSVAVIEYLDTPGDDLTEQLVLHMIVPPKDEQIELWDGARTGCNGAIEIFNADEAVSNKQLKTYLQKIINRNDTIYYDQSKNTSLFGSFFNETKPKEVSTISDIIRGKPNLKIKPLSPLVREMRAIKSDAEIAVMRRAGQISGRAYNQAYAQRFKNERTLASFLEYQFVQGGCSGHAYVPVVAGGHNSLSIHYTRNDDIFYNDELVLVDAAGKLGGYCADISRTWPVNGKFTDVQKDLYQAVLNVNKKCIEMCSEKYNTSIQQLYLKSINLLQDELKQLPGLSTLTRSQTMSLYPHNVGHHLGLDLHDVAGYSQSATLVENQVITIEPGVYFPLNGYEYPKHYTGIGIRVEDNIAIGKENYVNLTVEAAKEIVDIEHIASNGVTTPYEKDVVDVLDG